LGAPATVDAFVAGMRKAVDSGAHVVNVSYGMWDAYHDGSSPLAQAVDWAEGQGVLVFCAAGNSADDGRHALISIGGSASPVDSGFRVRETARLRLRLVWNDGKNQRESYAVSVLDAARNKVERVTVLWEPSESPYGTESGLIEGPVLEPGEYFLRVRALMPTPAGRRLHAYSENVAIVFASPDPNATMDTPADA
jgi:subtilisin family serine protease